MKLCHFCFTSLIDLVLEVFFHHLKSVLLSSLLLNNPPYILAFVGITVQMLIFLCCLRLLSAWSVSPTAPLFGAIWPPSIYTIWLQSSSFNRNCSHFAAF